MDYVAFAARFSIAPKDAYVLPALFEGAARKVGMPVRALVAQATYSNPALGDYLAAAEDVQRAIRGAIERGQLFLLLLAERRAAQIRRVKSVTK